MNQERKRILEMVQNGKLSAQEAIILLEALESDLVDKAVSEQSAVSEVEDKVQTVDSEPNQGNKNEKSKEKHENQNEDSFYSQLENAGERIFDFVSNALRKIKHIDLQFNQSVEIPHIFQQADSDIGRIDVDVANGPVKIITWDQSEVRVECQAKVYRSEDREDAKKYFLENTIFSIDNGLFCFATQSKWMKIETVIYIPKKQYEMLKVRIFNGGLSGENLHCDKLSVKTTNGKIELSHVEGKNFLVETVNGQIKLENSNANQLEAETVNGTVEVSGIFDNVKLQSFNGNIACKLPELGTNHLEAKAVTGNINLTLPDSATIDGDVRSNLGNYKLDLDGIDVMHEKKEIIQKQVKFKRTGSDERVIHVLADTKTGSVFVGKVESNGA